MMLLAGCYPIFVCVTIDSVDVTVNILGIVLQMVQLVVYSGNVLAHVVQAQTTDTHGLICEVGHSNNAGYSE